RRHDNVGKYLRFPTEAIIQSEVGSDLPSVLTEKCVVFILNFGSARRISRWTGSPRALKKQEQRTADTASRGTGLIKRSGRRNPACEGACASETFPSSWSETARCRSRGEAEEAGDTIENIATLKEAAEHLIVQSVNPFASELDVVPARNDREVVFYVSPPQGFIHIRIEKKWMTKPVAWPKSHRRVRGHIGSNRRTRPQLARV